MIAILISIALIGQSDSFASGAKIRHESNKMIMGMHNVPYDVADVMNGSNYSVEQATRIAAQRRQQQAREDAQQRDATIRQLRAGLSKATKNWATMNSFYDKIVSGELVIPDQERPTARGHIRTDISGTSGLVRDFGPQLPRNVRKAAEAHLKKAEAALAVLEKQGSPPATATK